uniref:FLYWCH-type domain-containing protein n=1 Tax=Cacopsylla melanoneura TaxID=428564 RepID=A0A8D9E0D5_9HEMI
MDNFEIDTVNGKYRLKFDGYTYGYSNLIGKIGSRWNCVNKPCRAFVNINRSKDKITGGDYIHTHVKEFSDPSVSPKEKNSPSSVKKTPSTGGNMSGLTNESRFDTTLQTPPPNLVPPSNSEQTPYTTPGTPTNTQAASLLEQRNVAIDTIAAKEREKEKLEADLVECKILIANLTESIKTIEAAWDADKAELEILRKQVPGLQLSCSNNGASSSSRENRTKLSIVGDSHVHNLEPVLCKIFPSSYDIKCYAKSGAGVEDICTLPVRQHGPQDIVVLFVGTNDVCKKSVAGLESSYLKLIDKFKGCKLVAILIPPRRNSAEFNTHIYSLNVKISNFLKKKGVSFVNPSIIIRSKHYNRDNLHLNKTGKTSLCQMIKSHVVEGKEFNTLTKPTDTNSNSHTRSDRANKSNTSTRNIGNKKTRTKHGTNTQGTGQLNYAGNANTQRPNTSKYSRYSGHNDRYPSDNIPNRDGSKWRKRGGKDKGKQVGRNSDPNFNTRVVYNTAYCDPGYYAPPPPLDHYDYELLSPYPYHYDYDHYYDPYVHYYDPYPYQSMTRSGGRGIVPRNTSGFF